MISLDEARAILLDGVAPLGTEMTAIGGYAGRILAKDVIADRDQPPNPVSAMDGYAIRRSDAGEGVELAVIGEAPAGAPFAHGIHAGQAVRIATGGVVPEGSDHVIIQEDVERVGDSIRVMRWDLSGAPSYIRPAGCDFARGQLLARAGQRVTPALHALLGAANLPSVEVSARPTVAILPSGDELREPGDPLGPGQIVNSASYALADLVELWGGQAIRLPILPDDPIDCEAALRSLDAGGDVLATIGGASVGDRDNLKPLLAKLGAEVLFDRIAVQPGKPSWHARFPNGSLVLGLPGNPASAFVCAHLLLKPLLYRLTGREAAEAVTLVSARLHGTLPANGDREMFMRARLSVTGDATLCAAALPAQDSSLVSILAQANCLIRRAPHAQPAVVDDLVEVLPIDGTRLAL